MLKYGEAIEEFGIELATLLTEEEYNQFIKVKIFLKKQVSLILIQFQIMIMTTTNVNIKSCINWRKSFKYKQYVDEFNIEFKNKKQQLLNFLDTYAISQRVNLQINQNITNTELDLIFALKEKYNIAICLMFPYNHDIYSLLINKIKINDIPFYFSYPITTIEELIGYINLGVSDVFVSGNLGFNLKAVHKLTKTQTQNIQVRCYPNICQNKIWFPIEGGLKDFFIRPEDIDLYSKYIDVIEFWNSEDKQNILYKIYFQTREWDGNLQEIIQRLQIPLNSYYILGDEFANRRMNCEQKCLQGKSCYLCNRLVQLAKAIEENNEYEVFKRS